MAGWQPARLFQTEHARFLDALVYQESIQNFECVQILA